MRIDQSDSISYQTQLHNNATWALGDRNSSLARTAVRPLALASLESTARRLAGVRGVSGYSRGTGRRREGAWLTRRREGGQSSHGGRDAGDAAVAAAPPRARRAGAIMIETVRGAGYRFTPTPSA